MSIKLSDLTVAQLAQALELRERIDVLNQQLQAVLGTPSAGPENGTTAPPKRRKRFSAAARKNMAKAQRARWAEKKQPRESVAEPASKPKRKVSNAVKAALSAAAKARWKKAKAAGKTRL